MNGLFLALFLLCFIALIIGIIKPQIVIRWGNEEKRNRKNVLMYYGIGVILFFVLFGSTISDTGTVKETSKIESQKKELTAEEKAVAEKAAADKVAADKVAAEKAAADKVVADKAAADKLLADKAAADKVAADKAAADKVAYDTGITYKQLARTPDDYKGKKVKFTGTVIQVTEGTGQTDLRVMVNDNSSTILYVAYDPKISSTRVLEDDIVTIKGISQGVYTYESTNSGHITIPLVIADIITIKD